MPLTWFSLAFLAGIILAAPLPLAPVTWLVLGGTALVAGIIARRTGFVSRYLPQVMIDYWQRISSPSPDTPRVQPLALLVLVCLGGARYGAHQPDLSAPDFIAAYNDQEYPVVVSSVVQELPDERDTYTNLRVRVESLTGADDATIEVHGDLLARVSAGEQFEYGDELSLSGWLETPYETEEFSYRDYLARQGVYAYMPQAKVTRLATEQGSPLLALLYRIKARSLETVYDLWPDPEASLLAGILLGVETGIPEPVQEAFQRTGTSHIIAISGFNITIIAGLFATAFSRLLGRLWGAVAAALGIAIYTLLVGADAAVVRAAIMGGLALFAHQIGRRQHSLNALTLSAGVMALFNPMLPWDVGFQLSFAATLGLVLYAEPLTEAFVRLASHFIPETTVERLVGPVGEYLLFTLAAQITTLPITAYYFQQLSSTSLVVNPVILPAQPAIMTLGGAALLLGSLWFPLGKLTAPLVWPFVAFTIRVVEFFGQFQGGVFALGAIPLFWVGFYYGVLFSLTWMRVKCPKKLPTIKPAAALGLLGILTVLVWGAALKAPDGRLHLTVLDVGTGEALLVESPSGRHLLINGGPSARALSDGLGRRLPPFQRGLDYLVVSPGRWESVNALPQAVERYTPAEVLWAGPISPSRASDYLREALTGLEIPVTPAETGQVLDLGEGARLEVLSAGSRGAILLLEWGNFKALLPLGTNLDDYEGLRMGADIGPVTALLLADNGYGPLNPPEWIRELEPQVVVLSVAADDRDGLPDRETLEAVEAYTLLRTDQHGWIEITTDGEEMWVAVER